LEQKNQENKGLIEEKAFVSQLQDQHSIELAKHKTKLEDACKHYQNTLKEEQLKLELKSQQLESAKSEIVAMNSKASKSEDDLEAQKAIVMELQEHISSLEKDIEDITSEKRCLEKSHAETCHLLSIAQQSASKKQTIL
jgi:chromosome segregation ATPase